MQNRKPRFALEHFGDRRRNAGADVRQRVQTGAPLDGKKLAQTSAELLDRLGCPSIRSDTKRVCALRLQQLRCLPQPLGDPCVVAVLRSRQRLRSEFGRIISANSPPTF